MITFQVKYQLRNGRIAGGDVVVALKELLASAVVTGVWSGCSGLIEAKVRRRLTNQL
jgi:hypothetical protein